MKRASSSGVLLGVFVLCTSFFLNCPYAICQSPPKASAKLTQSVVIQKMGPKPYCSLCGGDANTIKLSPDGAFLARLHTDFDPGSSESKGTNTLEVSDVRSASVIATFRTPGASFAVEQQGPDSLQYCDSGDYLLISAGPEKFYIVETKSYQQHVLIDLNFAGVRAALGANSHVRSTQVSCAADGNLATFYISAYGTGVDHGVTKMYNLDTGEEIHKPDQVLAPPGVSRLSTYLTTNGVTALFSNSDEGIHGHDEVFSRPGIGEVVVSPSGNHVAILEYGEFYKGKFSGGDGDISIVVVDMRSGVVSSRISAIDRYNQYTTPVMFAGESVVAMAENSNKVLTPHSSRQVLHLWNSNTGSEVQTVNNLAPKATDLSFWGMSADGRSVLAYTGKVSGKDLDKERDARFSLWDRESGKMIAQLPSIKEIHHGCPLILFMGKCDAFNELPHLTLSQSGNAVAAWYATGGQPVTVYTLPPTTPTH